ncbi:hypothetical protein IOM74_004266 [Salmonella enterica]|nr:hypothetical protein [Salmonella enterica]
MTNLIISRHATTLLKADGGRFYFDYVHASQDVLPVKQGISQHFLPLPCSATINHVLSMVCESALIAAFLIWCNRYIGIYSSIVVQICHVM